MNKVEQRHYGKLGLVNQTLLSQLVRDTLVHADKFKMINLILLK